MVPWIYLIVAGEIGVFIGFIFSASFSLYRIRRFNKNIAFYASTRKRNTQLYKSPMKISEITSVKDENNHIPG